MRIRPYLVAGVVAAGASAGLAIPTLVAQTRAFVPVTDAILASPEPGDWLHISRTYNQHRFSPLTQINKGNVAQLRMAWSRGLPQGTQESTPIVYRGVMYAMVPGAAIQALDATNGGDVGARIDLLRQRALAPFVSKVLGGTVTECDLVVKGILAGEARGWLMNPAGVFVSDRAKLRARKQTRIECPNVYASYCS